MTYPPYVREKARQLRIEKQLTVGEIAERLGIAKSTIFYWVGDLAIPRRPGSGFDLTVRQKGSVALQAKYRALREAVYDEGRRLYDELALEPGFKVFVAMYMAEGYKRDQNTVSLANSDSAIIKMATRWITRFTANKVEFRFQHEQRRSAVANVAVRARGDDRASRRYLLPVASRGLDGSAQGGLGDGRERGIRR